MTRAQWKEVYGYARSTVKAGNYYSIEDGFRIATLANLPGDWFDRTNQGRLALAWANENRGFTGPRP